MAWESQGTTVNDSVNLAPRAAQEPLHTSMTTGQRGSGGPSFISAIAEGMRVEASAITAQKTQPQTRRRGSVTSRRGSNESTTSTASLASELTCAAGGGGGMGFMSRRRVSSGAGGSGPSNPASRRGSRSSATAALSEMDESQKQDLERVRSAIKDLDAHTNSAVRELLTRHVNGGSVCGDEHDDDDGDDDMHNSLSSLDALSVELGDLRADFDDMELTALGAATKEGSSASPGGCKKVTEFRRAVRRLSVSCAAAEEAALLQRQDSNRSAGSLMKRLGQSLSGGLRLDDELVQR